MAHVAQMPDLFRLIEKLAKDTRQEIEQANLTISDFEGIARKYEIKFAWQELDLGTDGYYIKDARLITLNSQIGHQERRNFSFCHELIHDRIVCNDDFCEALHEATFHMSNAGTESIIEKLCNQGAAELLIPSDELRVMIAQQDFSVELIPELCDRFKASSLAVAFRMISMAEHSCHLLVADKREITPSAVQHAMFEVIPDQNWQLWVAYSASAPPAKYTLGRNVPILSGHLMYKALENEGKIIRGTDDIPRHNSKKHRWEVQCECMLYKGWVFGLFHETQPISKNQLRLF